MSPLSGLLLNLFVRAPPVQLYSWRRDSRQDSQVNDERTNQALLCSFSMARAHLIYRVQAEALNLELLQLTQSVCHWLTSERLLHFSALAAKNGPQEANRVVALAKDYKLINSPTMGSCGARLFVSSSRLGLFWRQTRPAAQVHSKRSQTNARPTNGRKKRTRSVNGLAAGNKCDEPRLGEQVCISLR